MQNSSDPIPSEVGILFALFNEIGIIEQLSRTAFQARLEDGLTVAHFGALNHLVRLGDGRTPISMAHAFQVPKTTMSHTLSGLEKRGLITMGPNPKDGRGKLVYLTDAGRARRDASIAALGPEIIKLLPQFSAAEAQELLPGLTRLREILDRSRD
jgi:DNA-binding MarR family transcriptional regulator